jgi:hypothetical protein
MATIVFDTTTVKGITENAVQFCTKRTGLDGEQVLQAMYRGDCCVCGHLRYGLAKGVAEYLGSVDETIKATYTYEPEYATYADEPIPDRPDSSPGINLIVWANRKSAALSSAVASMSSALTKEYKQLTCPKANAMCCELDIKVTDDHEVQKRSGYGALISSLYVHPIEIWRR